VAMHAGQEIGRTESDAFGEFKISRLSKDLGPVTVQIERESKSVSVEVDINDSTYIGCVEI
jgi:hypothetical protein